MPHGTASTAACATWCWSAIPGPGKTTLVEALLVATGTIQRAGRVEDGTTVSDFDEVEVRQQRSVNLTLAPLVHAGVKVNLLDTPGYADFTGDLRAGPARPRTRRCSPSRRPTAIDGVTRMLWEECAAVGMPRAVVITKIDHQRADFDAGPVRLPRGASATPSPRCTCR